jgi:hypothetical protein
MRVVTLIYFDDDEGTQEEQDTEQLDNIVDAGAQQLLVGRGGWLEDQSCLDLEKKGRAGQ